MKTFTEFLEEELISDDEILDEAFADTLNTIGRGLLDAIHVFLDLSSPIMDVIFPAVGGMPVDIANGLLYLIRKDYDNALVSFVLAFMSHAGSPVNVLRAAKTLSRLGDREKSQMIKLVIKKSDAKYRELLKSFLEKIIPIVRKNPEKINDPRLEEQDPDSLGGIQNEWQRKLDKIFQDDSGKL